MSENKTDGRVTKGKYHDWISDEGLKIIEGWARDGLSNKQIAHNIGIDEATFYTWQHKYDKFHEAVKKGKNGEETKHIEKTKKHIAADTTSMIFWLKNRKPDEWNDRREITHTGSIDSNVKMFETVSTDELRDIVSDVKDILRGDNQ
ncbi:MAG: helix-turn-helix domain-containing protein [Staphylococcus epidermidis]|nr:helix-turn-helix domain-containing protein [Staphylococcus epidermidis]